MTLIEAVVILVAGLVCLGVPIAAVVVVFTVARRSKSSLHDSRPCSNCGSHVGPQARFCHQCGNALQEQQGS